MSQLQLYFDDSNPNVVCSPSSAWGVNSSEVWTSGGSKVVSRFPGAQLKFTFNGTSAAFYGAALSDSTFTPVIDHLSQPSMSLPNSDPPAYGAWYRTPDLPPGPHTVTFDDLPRLTLDYIIVQVDPNTVFQNTLALISDFDTAISYTGSWKQNLSRFQTFEPFNFIGDYSTRSSCNPGDSLSVNFSGSDIQLWGVFDWMLNGDVTAAFYIDGVEIAEQRYQASTDSQHRINGVQTNYLLFAKNGLTDGPHNLKVTIASCTDQHFSLDYITYTPSFNKGKDAPRHFSSASKKFPPGAIAGIVVAAAVLVGITAFMIGLYKRRRKIAAEPFSVPPSSTVTTRKEEIPPHMRHLTTQASQDTIDLTEGTSGAEVWIIAPYPSDTPSIDELVPTIPPPAYRIHSIESAPPSMTEADRSSSQNPS